jgi:hypothetical protein
MKVLVAALLIETSILGPAFYRIFDYHTREVSGGMSVANSKALFFTGTMQHVRHRT